MSVKFPYEFRGKSIFGKIYRPVAKTSFQSPFALEWINIWLVVDTGADFTILPKYFAYSLKISLENDCLKDITEGVGGEQTIYFFKKTIKVKLGNISREIPMAFFDTDELPGLLGRLGFLETIDTEFLKSHTVVFKT